jgi:hypothetical protein
MSRKPQGNELDFDAPLAIGLTPDEIYAVCHPHTMQTAYEQHPLAAEALAEPDEFFLVVAQNERTGYRALIVASQPIGDIEFLVQLQVDDGYVNLFWEFDETKGGGNFAEVRKSAHEAFMHVCAMIGVQAGYVLSAKPTFLSSRDVPI